MVNGSGGYDYYVLDLTIVIDSMDLVVVNSANTLTSQSASGSYQWIDCFTNLPIPGETNASFSPSQTGNYAVIISDSSCSDTSVCSFVMIPITENVTSCGDYTWPFNNQTYSSVGSYTDSIQVSGGFQVATLVLTAVINPSDLVVVNTGTTLTSQSTLSGYQWIDCTTNQPIIGATNQSFTPAQTGNYAVIISDSSCSDTSVCLFVMIPITENVTSCGDYTWPFNNQTYSSVGSYTDSIQVSGGFQVATLVLTAVINPSDLVVVNAGTTLTSQSTLSGYQWIDCTTNQPIIGATNQSFTPTQSGSYAVIISDSSCSDTSVCLFVMIPITENVTSCGDYTWPFNNQTYTSAGTYADSVQIAGGFQTAVLVLTTVITPADLVVTDSANVLTSQSTLGNYQWIDCATNLPISGATNQSFTPTQSGSYAVIISDSSCMDTSVCTVIQGVGLQSLMSTFDFAIVPNPTNDFVTLSFDGNQAFLVITDLKGKIILSDDVSTGDTVDLSSFKSGVYFFNMTTGGNNQILRVVRQ